MKKISVLGLLIVVFSIMAVSAAAQMTYSTSTMAYTSVNDCWSRCQASCQSQQLSSERCQVYCNSQCGATVAPPPISQETTTNNCMSNCNLQLGRCQEQSTNTAVAIDCRGMFIKCTESCKISMTTTPQESCPDMCKRLASPNVYATAATAGFNTNLFMTCMRDRCNEGCESSCRLAYSDESLALNCIERMCRQPPMMGGCEERVRARVQAECDQSGVDSASCALKIRQAIMAECNVPSSCEGRCEMLRNTCTEAPEVCEQTIATCKRACSKPEMPQTPECPPPSCPGRCGNAFADCVKSGGNKVTCQANLGVCIDGCDMGNMPECRDACIRRGKACIDSGANPADCTSAVDDCMRECSGVGVPPMGQQCEQACVNARMDCQASGYTDAECAARESACLRACHPMPSTRVPTPEEMRGLNPQPEPPSWWARLTAWFRGG